MTAHLKRMGISSSVTSGEGYKIIERAENSIFYRLAELDGTPSAGITSGNR